MTPPAPTAMPLITLVHELSALALSLALVLGYHTYMHWRVRSDPHFSVHAVNQHARRRWVDAMMASGGHGILAVQTLRNSVMACSFMASTAVLLIIGVLNLSSGLDKPGGAWRSINALAAGGPEVHLFNAMLLTLDFFCAFFFFSMAIRYYNHVGYMINLPAGEASARFSPEQVTAFLNRAGNYYSYGTRTFFFCLPLVFWFFGPQYMLLATLGLIAVLYTMDRAPRETRE